MKTKPNVLELGRREEGLQGVFAQWARSLPHFASLWVGPATITAPPNLTPGHSWVDTLWVHDQSWDN